MVLSLVTIPSFLALLPWISRLGMQWHHDGKDSHSGSVATQPI